MFEQFGCFVKPLIPKCREVLDHQSTITLYWKLKELLSSFLKIQSERRYLVEKKIDFLLEFNRSCAFYFFVEIIYILFRYCKI